MTRSNDSDTTSEGKVYGHGAAAVIDLPCFSDPRGSLSVVEESASLPFSVRRAFWIFGVPSGRGRGGHAHRRQWQLIAAVAGALTVILDDGDTARSYRLDSPRKALLVPPGIWNILENFSRGAVCLVLASGEYDESEYIREYPDFISFRSSQSPRNDRN